MNTLTNIVPNPLTINKVLNSNYSTTRFATSDYDGKNNTEVISKYKDNIIPSKMPANFYLGGIGEIGLLMENVNFINNIINSYNGNLISLDAKYASSTFYNEANVFNKNYTITNDINDIWYYDTTYGLISHDSISSPYKSIPMYKYNIKDFDSTEDDYDELDNQDLYLGENQDKEFHLLDYVFYSQDDILDELENTMTYTFFYEKNQNQQIKYAITDFSNVLEFTTNTVLEDPDGPDGIFGAVIEYQTISVKSDIEKIYVKSKADNTYIECKILNNEQDRFYYVYYELNGLNYLIYSNNYNIDVYKSQLIDLLGGGTIVFSNIFANSIDCYSSGGNVIDVYIYYQFQEESISQKLNRTLGLSELNKDNIFEYPIYSTTINSITSYSFPLLPSKKMDNYYDCEFYFVLPAFNKKTELNNINYTINNINNNIKISLKFGDGEIKEILEPYIKLYDAIVYKFKKSYLFDHMFIPNQELVISLLDYSQPDIKSRVLWSKKLFFNLFRLSIQQGKYQEIDLRVRYTNYYPLKYPLLSKRKFIELNYIPIDNISNVSENILLDANENFKPQTTTSDNPNDLVTKISNSNDNLSVNINDLSNNYAYLKSDIYHNISEGTDMLTWFLTNNSNGLRIGTSDLLEDNQYSTFNFSLSNNVLNNYDVENINVYYKNFIYYDHNGILDGLSSNVKTALQVYDGATKFNNFSIPIYGMKQILYIPYNFNINNVYNHSRMAFESGLNGSGQRLYSIFEDYIIIYNNTHEPINSEVNLYFSDDALTLCEGTRMISIRSGEKKIYKPSKHKDYSIIIKNVLLNKYKLKLYKIYEASLNSGSARVDNIITILDNMLDNGVSGYASNAKEQDNSEIVNIPIYDYTIPLFGNLVVIEKL